MTIEEAKRGSVDWMRHAVDAFEEANHIDGDLLSHDWLQWALMLPQPRNIGEAQECQFINMHRVDLFRDYLLTEKNIALQNVRGKGYRIVPPHEQAQYAAETALTQVVKGLQRGSKLMTHTRVAILSDDEKKRHTDAEIRLSGLGQIVSRQRRDVFKLFWKEKDAS